MRSLDPDFRHIAVRMLLGVSVTAGLVLLSAVLPRALADAPQGWVSHTWKSSSGLCQDSVMAIAQTQEGYLWLGTEAGLSRFDGVRFKNFGLSDGLGAVSINALLDAGPAGLWIGTAGGGLSRWRDGLMLSSRSIYMSSTRPHAVCQFWLPSPWYSGEQEGAALGESQAPSPELHFHPTRTVDRFKRAAARTTQCHSLMGVIPHRSIFQA